MIKAAVIGATGYVGQELIRLLIQHPNVDVTIITSRTNKNEKYFNIYRNYVNITKIVFTENNIEKISQNVDVIFLALPHGVASNIITKKVLKNAIVIDLGADYRLKDVDIYQDWYNTKHGSENLIDEAIYGLCELKRDEIRKFRLIANPGCYTTCSILSLAPLMNEDFINRNSIIIDAKSGVTGAGRSVDITTHYTECNESIKAYKIASHRHTPEIEEQLSSLSGEKIRLIFTPHLIPMNRGILATCYVPLLKDVSLEKVIQIYEEFYKDEYFVRILEKGTYPETKWVKGSNYCDISINLDKRTNTLIIIGAIDNLLKGAAGQAVQNMNIVFGFEEKMGIDAIPMFPV